MAGRFPRARNVNTFWKNIKEGVECISQFSIEELEVRNAAELARNPRYVRARSVIDDVDLFDAAFFGILPKEAELIDPQHRVFLECCWEALEDAGYDPHSYPGAIGVYAGCSPNTYFMRNVCSDRGFTSRFTEGYQIENYLALLGSNCDFLSTRVSYKLNLKGPSFTLACGCSTSLVAVSQACQSLLNYQCDMSLAGGVSITLPQKRGYLYQEGAMGSADGHCRPFDAEAQGTVFGSGSGVVVLKRLEDALADGDHVYAVIKGFAVNNDGASKVGFTAPSSDGQAKVIALAHALAGIDPESISYVEAHGTATPLGDPIEFTALSHAFKSQTSDRGYCAIGSVKMNVGHLDAAAGVAGLINVAQMLHHKQLPPAIHFRSPNPGIDLEKSPFYVNASLAPWKRGSTARRAGVSSFGVGGTNAHVVVEEAPPVERIGIDRSCHLLVLSARSGTALDQATTNIVDFLKANPEVDLGSVAFTLQSGRRAFEHRRAVVCKDRDDAIAAFQSLDAGRVMTRVQDDRQPRVVFMFPGQGAQYPRMGAKLYGWDRGFRSDVDTCAEILKSHLGLDLRAVLFSHGSERASNLELRRTALAQPALFVIEYGLARLWTRWGIHPQGMIGHSVGELVAACLSGVFTIEEALAIVATRGRLIEQLPPGAMLAIRLPEDQVTGLLGDDLSLAAVNSPMLCVVSGPETAVARLAGELESRRVATRRLSTSHAFHSHMMDEVIKPFSERLSRYQFQRPQVPFVSCVTGKTIKDEEATDPRYWAGHVRAPVRFSAGISELSATPGSLFLEVGPGRTLCTLVHQHNDSSSKLRAIRSLGDSSDECDDAVSVLEAAGRLWLEGVTPNWAELYNTRPRRVPLPTYPFERKRFWIDLPSANDSLPDADDDRGHSKSSPPSNGTAAVNIMTEAKLVEVATPGRSDRIRQDLVAIFRELSGVEFSEAEHSASFLEMGFDSLFLTQVAQALQAKFDLRITFRQLLDEESTLEALTVYIDGKLPSDALPALPPGVPTALTSIPFAFESKNGECTLAAHPANGPTLNPSPPLSPPIVASSGVEAIVREQLLLMAKQIDLLRGIGAPSAQPPEQSSAVPASAPTIAIESQKDHAPAKIADAAQESKRFGPFRPIQKGSVDGLSEDQARHLDNLIKRYTARTASSKQYTQRHRSVLADPRAASGFRLQWKEMVYPIVSVRSRGSRFWDIDGNEYIDLVNGYGPIMLGHAPEFVTRAVAQQLEQGFETGPQSAIAGEVATLISELTGMERVTFCNTGSEAVMAAIRVARTVTGRSKFVSFSGDYHGTFDEVLVKGISRAGVPQAMPVAPGIPAPNVGQVTVLDYATAESLEYLRTKAGELAAVLVEPVQSRHPGLQPVEFLRELRKITADSGTALVFDEIVTGFRVHPGGAQAVFDIRADLATYGKVLGGGLPIGVLAGRPRFMDALDGGAWQYGDDSYPETGVTFFAGTFVRHPLALAAARAVLRHLKEQGPGLQQALNEKTTRLVQTLNRFLEEREVPAKVEQFGSLFYLSFPVEIRFASLFYFHMREKGIQIQEGFPCFLTTAHSDADLDRVVHSFRESILEMQAGGLLPAPNRDGTINAPPTDAVQNRSNAPLPADAPLTEPQMEILLSARLSDEANCAYNESFTIRMRGELNQSALISAVQHLIDRHDALRITIDPRQNRIRAREQLSLDLTVVDLTEGSPDEREGQAAELIREDAGRPFDLEAGPLIRGQLLRFEQEHHWLVLTTHHIICDGWSTNILIDELGQIYNALCRGTVCGLPAPRSFIEYAHEQANGLTASEHVATETWWCDKFRTTPAPLELPTDRPRPAVKSFRGATARSIVGPELYAKIKRSGAHQGCTLFGTLLAAFNVLLHRLSGQEEIVVGIPAAGQSLLEGQALVGHCVNFLPLRSYFDDGSTVASFLHQVKGTLLDAYEHQNYTFGSLVRKLALPRDPSRLPLVETQFNLERVGTGSQLQGLRVEIDPNPKGAVNFDLFLNVVESDRGLTIDCDYNSELFDRQTVDRWLEHYATILESMAGEPNQLISRLTVLNQQERRRLLVEWNRTAFKFPEQMCVHQLIEEQAARTPTSIAAVFEDQRISYQDLNKRSNQLARYLRENGIGPEKPVAVCLDRSLDLIVGLLGVLKAGAAYVPLDPNYPRARIESVVEDSRTSVLLTHDHLAGSLEALSPRIICIDTDWPAIARQDGDDLPCQTKPDYLAYVIYTSGSTGRPKGVEITHRNVVNLLCSMAREPGLSPEDRLLAITTVSFDISALELFLPLVTGARLVVASRETAMDGHQLVALMNSSGATVLQATPATWRLLLEAGWPGKGDLKILCGGEALSRELADQLLPRAASVWNMYGPTETTIWSAVGRVEAGSRDVPIGPPIGNTQFFVLDKNRELVPIGVSGELCIGGAGVARGYWRDPAQTSEKFVADPFSAEAGALIYRTGDLVRYLPDGTLEFLGRSDTQVKIRGFRIETSEVETVLRQHPGIRECVVAARADDGGDKRLVAYFIGTDSTPPVGELRSFIGGRLPDYMVPSNFVMLDAFPLTPNGKVNRKALPAPKPQSRDRNGSFNAPKKPMEVILARICADVLKLEKIGVEESLFDLGADSIQLFQIAARAEDMGVKLAPTQIMSRRTIAAICAEFDGGEKGNGETHEPRLMPVSRERYRTNRSWLS
jgi:amino acid adenylation domain-containing protein